MNPLYIAAASSSGAKKKAPAKRAPAKKVVKKRAAPVIKKDLDEEKWDKWESRLKSLAILVAGIAGIINELFLRSEPRETALVFLGTLIGLPLVISGAKRGA